MTHAASVWRADFRSDDQGGSRDPLGDRHKRTGDAPHKVGVGGALGLSGLGGAFRFWPGKQLGIDLTAAWYRPTIYSPTITAPSTIIVMPSFLFLFAKPDPNKDIDIRPFAGGGVSYSRGGYVYLSPLGAPNQRAGGWGVQTFGGVEMAFKDAPAFVVSAEVIYYHVPVSIAASTPLSGVTTLVLFHFYLK